MCESDPIIILLVEDDPAHAVLVQRHIEPIQAANRIIHVEDGQAALDYLNRENGYADEAANPQPHLILLDLRLPKVDGLEVLERVKRNAALKHIPVVVLTTSDAESDIAKSYIRGASSYLVKPVNFEKFATLMKSFGFYWLTWNQFSEVH